MTEEEHALRSVIAQAYHVAVEAGHSSACVAIHVGQDVWDYLRALANQLASPPIGPTALFCGFPLLLEAAWEPGRVEVHTIKRISS